MNTSKKLNITPAALAALAKGDLANFMAAATLGGIEAQEKQGQIEQSFAETLPKQGTDGEQRKVWEVLGFQFGDDADDLFVNVKFPAGWRKKPTDHSMWTHLLDDKGRKRAAIFYKAAFYDRSSHVGLIQRYSATHEPILGWAKSRTSPYIGVVKDGERVIWKTEPTKETPSYKETDAVRAQAEKWLKQHYPDWNNVAAYWDQP